MLDDYYYYSSNNAQLVLLSPHLDIWVGAPSAPAKTLVVEDLGATGIWKAAPVAARPSTTAAVARMV